MAKKNGWKNDGPKPQRSHQMPTPAEVKDAARRALASAKKLDARARANKQEANVIQRESCRLRADMERLVFLTEGGFSMTVRKKDDDHRPEHHERRHRRHERKVRSLTQRVCDGVRTFGRQRRGRLS